MAQIRSYALEIIIKLIRNNVWVLCFLSATSGSRCGLHGNADRIMSHVLRRFFLLRASSEQK